MTEAKSKGPEKVTEKTPEVTPEQEAEAVAKAAEQTPAAVATAQATPPASASTGTDMSDSPEEEQTFAGQLLTSEHYTVSSTDTLGRELLEIKPVGWVGPGFEVPAVRVKELIKLLSKVKGLPKE